MPRPVLGSLRFSTGALVCLEGPLLIGRSPQLDRSVSGESPQLVTVPSPDQDVSRNHVEIRLEGWHVILVDLNSTNGTSVTIPGEPPQRMRPGEAIQIYPGTVVTLADVMTFSYEPPA
ncbi:MAG: FHA domain-containing protein [Acidimicrobiales bacterium]